MRSSYRARGGAAVLLLLGGLLCAALFRVVGGTEQHAYAPGALAPEYVRVTEGRSYQLSVAGGVRALERRGIDVTTPRCSYAAPDAAAESLTVQAAGADTKATDVVGVFVAPLTGSVHVDCLGWGPMFVDDADNAAPDVAGWLLALAIVLLTVGSGLGLSALRAARAAGPRRAVPDTGDESIERLVRLVHARSEDDDTER